MRFFCKDDRCEWWVLGNPAVKTAGFKMIDVNCASISSNEFSITRKNLGCKALLINDLNIVQNKRPSKPFEP